jgi:hypothetical protein
MINEVLFQLEDASNLLNDQTVDACVTSQSGGSESDCNTEEQDVTDNQSKRRKPVARRATSVKWNETNDDCLIRKLFPGSDSKELSMQAPPKVNLNIRIIHSLATIMFYTEVCSDISISVIK